MIAPIVERHLVEKAFATQCGQLAPNSAKGIPERASYLQQRQSIRLPLFLALSLLVDLRTTIPKGRRASLPSARRVSGQCTERSSKLGTRVLDIGKLQNAQQTDRVDAIGQLRHRLLDFAVPQLPRRRLAVFGEAAKAGFLHRLVVFLF